MLAHINYKAGIPTPKTAATMLFILLVTAISINLLSTILVMLNILKLTIHLIPANILLWLPLVCYIFRGFIKKLERVSRCESELIYLITLISASDEPPLRMLYLVKDSSIFHFSKEMRLSEKLESLLAVNKVNALKLLARTHPSPLVSKFLEDVINFEYLSSTTSIVRSKLIELIRDLKTKLEIIDTQIINLADIMFNLLITVPCMLTTTMLMVAESIETILLINTILSIVTGIIMYSITSSLSPSLLRIDITRRTIAKFLTILIISSLLLHMIYHNVLNLCNKLWLDLLLLSIIASLVTSIPVYHLSNKLSKIAYAIPSLMREIIDRLNIGEELNVILYRIDHLKFPEIFFLKEFRARINAFGIREAFNWLMKLEIPLSVKYIFEILKYAVIYGTKPKEFESLLYTSIEVASLRKSLVQKLLPLVFYSTIGLLFYTMIPSLIVKYVFYKLPITGVSVTFPLLIPNSDNVLLMLSISAIISSITLSLILGSMRDGHFIFGLKYLPLLLLSSYLGMYLVFNTHIFDVIIG